MATPSGDNDVPNGAHGNTVVADVKGGTYRSKGELIDQGGKGASFTSLTPSYKNIGRIFWKIAGKSILTNGEEYAIYLSNTDQWGAITPLFGRANDLL